MRFQDCQGQDENFEFDFSEIKVLSDKNQGLKKTQVFEKSQ